MSNLVYTPCSTCAINVYLDAEHLGQLQRSRKSFWCPNGHEQAFTGATPEQKRIAELEREVARTKADRDRAYAALNRCPRCGASFKTRRGLEVHRTRRGHQ